MDYILWWFKENSRVQWWFGLENMLFPKENLFNGLLKHLATTSWYKFRKSNYWRNNTEYSSVSHFRIITNCLPLLIWISVEHHNEFLFDFYGHFRSNNTIHDLYNQFSVDYCFPATNKLIKRGFDGDRHRNGHEKCLFFKDWGMTIY